jgi:hypothetical protein
MQSLVKNKATPAFPQTVLVIARNRSFKTTNSAGGERACFFVAYPNPKGYTDPDGRFPFLVLGIAAGGAAVITAFFRYTRPGAFLFTWLVSRFLPITREMFDKELHHDGSSYIQGLESNIAKTMSIDSGFISAISADIQNNPDSTIGQGSFSGDKMIDTDSYNTETGMATATITVTDTFTFEKHNPPRPFPKETLTSIGRTSGITEYPVTVTVQMQVPYKLQGLEE